MLQLESIRTKNNGSTTSLNAKSALYRIYSEGDINTDMDNTDIYSNLNNDINKHPQDPKSSSKSPHSESKLRQISTFLWKIVLLGFLGNCYFWLLESIDIGKRIQLPSLEDFQILFVFSKLEIFQQLDPQLKIFINHAIFGILLGTIDAFFFDSLLKSHINIPKRSTKNQESTTIIRSLIAIVGIAYGLKTLEWESSLQASLAWSLLNPCLWILMDGTIYGFIIDSIVTISLCYLSYQYDPAFFLTSTTQEFWSKILWIGSAGFVGLLVFGKVGRFLFE